MQGAFFTRSKTGAEPPVSTGPGPIAIFARNGRPLPGDQGASSGMTALEILLVMAMIGIMLTLSVGWAGSLSKRRLQNAAYLIEGDLRLAQQAAVAGAGTGPQAEFCLRPDGYDIYTVVYQDPAGRTSPVVGNRIKTANAGQEYQSGIQITPDAMGAVACTVDATRQAIAFLATGAPNFPDSNSHGITLALRGQSLSITIQPVTGMATVGR